MLKRVLPMSLKDALIAERQRKTQWAETEAQDRCMKRFVQTAGARLRFLLNQKETSQYSATTASDR